MTQDYPLRHSDTATQRHSDSLVLAIFSRRTMVVHLPFMLRSITGQPLAALDAQEAAASSDPHNFARG
ncbi:hypothetical protein HBI56_226570 [Parastagonospora nodorum]|nr:hypothetical protein HBH53_233600 [Parastagonospora nodorum]KAH4155911.1 hypothetical protein HBH43_209840 [Parastagonospora nodorum]KAH4182276.1 hypothetical protein HBH42_223280 [Parastagonospora nodorum]KAH4597755.1 hypothetical protein HBH82_217590 [Parastagonospora nodorum]KAH4661323.1 hypothetical protein HBH78_223920 [Parastagonospora nodorum]